MRFSTPQGATLLPTRNTAYLDSILLTKDGKLRCLPAKELLEIPNIDLRVWAAGNGVYQFPTQELVDWIARRIEGKVALEIGAGNGYLGYYLGIPSTDSYQQVDHKDTLNYLQSVGQKPTSPNPKYVERLGAGEAIHKYQPEIVVAAWVTQKWTGIPTRKGITPDGNVWGVDEEDLLSRVSTYLFVGNEHVHHAKSILSTPHKAYSFPEIVSRASKPEGNIIYVWERKSTPRRGKA